MDRFDHVWYWKPNAMRVIDRKGQACRVLAEGRKNSILVEFEDGFKTVTSRYAVRKLESKQTLSIQQQTRILLDTSALLERLAIRFNASFDIPTLRLLKSGLSLLNTHALAKNGTSTQ